MDFPPSSATSRGDSSKITLPTDKQNKFSNGIEFGEAFRARADLKNSTLKSGGCTSGVRARLKPKKRGNTSWEHSADFLQYLQIFCNTLQIFCNTCRFSAILCRFSAKLCRFSATLCRISAIPADFLQHSRISAEPAPAILTVVQHNALQSLYFRGG